MTETRRSDTTAEPRQGVVALLEGVRVKHFTSPLFRPDGLDATISRGEVLLVTGPSGCGKSSLAMTLNGLVPHHIDADLEGSVVTLGRDVASSQGGALVREVGMVFQDPDAQIVTTSVLDEVCFGLENLEIRAEEIEPRAMAALALVGLDGRAEEPPAHLSGGQRQRLALACALAIRPQLLVLDEPTSHIDPRGAGEFYALLPDLAATGITIVVIDHDLDPVLGYADRLLVLDRLGKVLAEGSPSDVLARESNRIDAVGVRLPTAVRVVRALERIGAEQAGSAITVAQAREALASADVREFDPRRSVAAPRETGEEILLSAEHLSVRRSRRAVIPDLSLAVHAGESVALIGENGAGKTTAGLALAGLIRSRGGLDILGSDPRRLSMRELSDRVGYVFQNPEHQFITNTVSDEIAHALRRRKAPDAAVRATVDELLERLSLTHVRNQHPFLLSGGEKRRLSVATVLSTRPRLLLLDEPSYGLDQGATEALMRVLAEINDEGAAILMIVHDLALAADHADRVVILRNGAIAADGPAPAILANDERLIESGLAPLPVRECLSGLRRRHPRFDAVYRVDQLERTR